MNHLFIDFTVRITLIAVCTGIILRAGQIRSAKVRHRVWTGVMLLMLVLPLWITWGPKARLPVSRFLPSPSGDAVVRPPESRVETVEAPSSSASAATGQPSAQSD